MLNQVDQNMKGIAALFFAYFIWGAMPVYWKALEAVSSFEILGHRVIWSALFTFLLMFGHRNRMIFMDMLKERKRHLMACRRRIPHIFQLGPLHMGR